MLGVYASGVSDFHYSRHWWLKISRLAVHISTLQSRLQTGKTCQASRTLGNSKLTGIAVFIESFHGRSSQYMRSPRSWGPSARLGLYMVWSLLILGKRLWSFKANYKSAIDVYEGGSHIRTVPGYSNTSTAGIFCTYPAAFMTKTGQFFSEFIASMSSFSVPLKPKLILSRYNLNVLHLQFTRQRQSRRREPHSPRSLLCDLRDRRLFRLGNWLCDKLGKRLWTKIDVFLSGVWAWGVVGWELLFLGTDGCTILRMHLWRLALRCVYLHW